MQNNEELLTLIVPHELKDEIVDLFMCSSDISGFSLGEIMGYSRDHSHYNNREQVEGYRQFYRFEVMHETRHQSQLLALLKEVCGGNVRYWSSPLSCTGHI